MSLVAEKLTVATHMPEGVEDLCAQEISRPRVLVVCPRVGVSSEVWLWRQLVGFSSIHAAVLCWEHLGKASFPLEDIHVFKLPVIPRRKRIARAFKRLTDTRDLNFYAPHRAEEREIEEIIDEFAPKAILCQYGYTALRLLRAARRCGVPLIVHFHGHDASAMLRDPLYRLSIRRALPKFAGVIVVARYQYDWAIRNKSPIGHTHIIPCGVPIHEYECSRGPEADTCTFLSVGRFVEKKGVAETVQAFARASRSAPHIQMEMIGEGPLLDNARILSRNLGVEKKIKFLGGCSPAKVKEAFERCSVFVQHSVTASNGDCEGWPVAVAEAMASGLPIISTLHASIPEQVQQGVHGILTNERDVDGAADAMIKLAGDKALRVQMGRAAREFAAEKFDVRRRILCLERAIRCVIAEANCSR